MARRIVVKNLSSKEFEKAKRKIERYQKTLENRCINFCTRLSEIGANVSRLKVSESPLGKYITVTTEVIPQSDSCKAIIMAIGSELSSNGYAPANALLLVEFGAGIYHNSLPNPFANDTGYGVGTFPNQTHAFEDGWFYPKKDGTWGYTHGVKATMPMYNADIEIILNISKIAKEVFRSR